MIRLVINLRKAQMVLFGRGEGAATHVAPHVRRTEHGMSYVRAFDRKGRASRGRSDEQREPTPAKVRAPRDGGDWFKLVRAADLHGQIDHPELQHKLAHALAGNGDLDEAIEHAQAHLDSRRKPTAQPPVNQGDTRTLHMFGGRS